MTFAPTLLAAILATAPAAPRDAFADFPRLDQLHQVTLDGHADENAQMNCIPTSIAAGLEFLTGRTYRPDTIKHAIYGASYVGPTQIIKYLDYVEQQGVRLSVFTSKNPETLVAELRRRIAAGTPVVITLPADLGAPPADLLHPKLITHVAVAAGFDERGDIRVMNPWGGVWIHGNDAYWASRICYGELWSMERAGHAPAVPQVNVQQVSAGQVTAPVTRAR